MSTSGADDPALDRAIGALMGLAVGDAIGTTVEFLDRDSFAPVTDMTGGGPFGLEPGQWTDDTSMALCLADSLLKARDFDADDLMKRFVSWWLKGAYSVKGACFDIGLTTRAALRRFRQTGEPFSGDPRRDSAGNGSLMRMAPAAILGHRCPDLAVRLAVEQSRTTHPAPQCLDACAVFARMLSAAISGEPKTAVLDHARSATDPDLDDIRARVWRSLSRETIRSSGYVVHTLEAALWAVDRSDSFEEAVLLAVNLGDDADTVGAVTGQLAGALWGESAIPERWIERLWWSERIRQAATALFVEPA
jgi:ADP-ribosyl-[dinitrogen reductase] hydrolase